MTDAHDDTINERLAKHEEQITGIREDVTRIILKIDNLASDVASKNRTNWTTMFGGGSFLLAAVIAIVSMGMNPLKSNVDRNTTGLEEIKVKTESVRAETERLKAEMEARKEENSRSINDRQAMRIAEAATREKLAEVETQFHESRNIKNMQVQHLWILLNETRRDCKQAAFDMPTFWPSSVPGRVPDRSQ